MQNWGSSLVLMIELRFSYVFCANYCFKVVLPSNLCCSALLYGRGPVLGSYFLLCVICSLAYFQGNCNKH